MKGRRVKGRGSLVLLDEVCTRMYVGTLKVYGLKDTQRDLGNLRGLCVRDPDRSPHPDSVPGHPLDLGRTYLGLKKTRNLRNLLRRDVRTPSLLIRCLSRSPTEHQFSGSRQTRVPTGDRTKIRS